MRVVGRERLQAFCVQHADTRQWIEAWLSEVEAATWLTSADIKKRYASASFLGDKTVIFNVRGNHYRMETTVAYRTGVVVVAWIGTHAEYDRRNRKRQG